jgi:aryl-alcohol dehydrogenase-like predicted oxidoreductase
MPLDATLDLRATFPRFTPEARKVNWLVVKLLEGIAQRKQATAAQIALAWLLAKQPWIVPIPGTRRLDRLEENLGALAVTLNNEEIREIDAASTRFPVKEMRLPEFHMKLIDR